MEFPRQDYWTGLPFSSPRDLPNPGRFEECFIANKTLPSEPSEGHNLFAAGGGLVTLSCPTLKAPRTVAHQALLSMGFPRQES